MTDLATLTEELKQARGKEYIARLEYIFKLVGDDIKADVAVIREVYGKFTPVDIGIIVIKYNLNFKAVCEWMEQERIIPAAMYSHMMDNGLKVKDILAAAQIKLTEIQTESEG